MLDNKYKKHKPFEVPKGYFDSLEQNVMSQIDSLEVKVENPKSKRRWLVPLASAAAALVLIFVVIQDKTGVFSGSTSSQPSNVEDTKIVEEYFSFIQNELLEDQFEEYYFNDNE